MSERPPGSPVIRFAYCVSSSSVPSCVPPLSSRPEDIVASRMLFISCCMNSASNCLAAALIVAFGSLDARAFSAAALGSRSVSSDARSALPGRRDTPAI